MNYLMNQQGDMFEFSAHKTPVFKELKNKEWILWGYSDDYDDQKWNNRLPDYYEWLYNSSSKHRAIINRKVLFIVGQGLKAKDKGLTLTEQIELRSFIFKLNDSELVRKLSYNLTKLGGFCYEVIPDKAGKKISPYYVNLKDVRRSKKEYDKDGKELPPVYYYTSDWSARKPEENKDFTTFHAWDWSGDFEKSKRYLVLYQEDSESTYPIPEYTAAVPYIAADYEISNFVYNNTKNGFSAGWLVNFFNGQPKEEEKAAISHYWKQKLHGSDNGGEPVLSFNDVGVPGVDITPLNPNGQDDRFINLNKQIREEIYSGHTVNPLVTGLPNENGGFANNADESRVATEQFQLYYVTGKQIILEAHINAIRAFNEIKGEVYIQRLEPIKAALTEQTLLQVLTKNEVREMAGYEALEEETPAQTEGLKKETVIREFSTDFSAFAEYGVEDSTLEFLGERELFCTDVYDALKQGESFKREFTSQLEKGILAAITENPDVSVKELAELLKKSSGDINQAIKSLESQGLLDNGTITPEGADEVDEIFVVYKYVLRADAPPLETESRAFCQMMVKLSKDRSWTIQDIQAISAREGYDVFTRRGGWYHNPETGRNTPYCRHQWQQRLVRRTR